MFFWNGIKTIYCHANQQSVLFFWSLWYKGKMSDLLKTIIAISFISRYYLFYFHPCMLSSLIRFFCLKRCHFRGGWGSVKALFELPSISEGFLKRCVCSWTECGPSVVSCLGENKNATEITAEYHGAWSLNVKHHAQRRTNLCWQSSYSSLWEKPKSGLSP